MVLLLRKLYLYFTKDPEGSIIFQGGWVSNFFQGGGGPNSNFFRNPCTYLLFSRGGGVSGTPIPLWIRTWAMTSQRGNIYHSPASDHNCQALICQD